MVNQIVPNIFIGEMLQKNSDSKVSGEFVKLSGESFYKIQNYDQIPPFFISLVSSSNHWFFISSTGGLSAGRMNKDHALFPYYTEDKLAENSENTGGKAIFLINRESKTWLWEPFSIRQQGLYHIRRNLYKNILGTALIFEEINHTLDLVYRYSWRMSERFGFIKTSCLVNDGTFCEVEVLDGIQNVLPANTASQIQTTLSCLLDAYKRSEVDPESGLGIFALNSSLTDLAEPSESLSATTVFQIGLLEPDYLLSSTQLDTFRSGASILPEQVKRGNRGSYFVHSKLELHPAVEKCWYLVADVCQDSSQVVSKQIMLKKNPLTLKRDIEFDIAQNSNRLFEIISRADGPQLSANKLSTAHHFANVMFNVMRGGVFPDQYFVEKKDFLKFVTTHHKQFSKDHPDFFHKIPDRLKITELHNMSENDGNPDLIRLSYSYLPLFFSRRHGDPSRPWNQFNINIRNADGSDRLDYEGNWRDIFQNWEALAYSFPEFVESMIFSFLNATTVDGYNAYRITRAGIEWEKPEPGNPWANIGYWSDHQIIYLLKLLEISKEVHPGYIQSKLPERIISSANVPYRIKPYEDLVQDPYNTINFDYRLDDEIQSRVKEFGTDGKLVRDKKGNVIHRSLLEKLLILLLAKLVNYVPEGGIWMNTQRPEWNDANNALVGKGLSVVTLGYLYRFVNHFLELLSADSMVQFEIGSEVVELFNQISKVLEQYQSKLSGAFSPEDRREVMDALGLAGSLNRQRYYEKGLSQQFEAIVVNDLKQFLTLIRQYFAHTLKANGRDDGLYHAYNILHLGRKTARIERLSEMLEGQVSILSSGILNGDESVELLNRLKTSRLYQADQNSYILYPDKELPGFLEKNCIKAEQLEGLSLPDLLIEKQDRSLFIRDENGNFHFSGSLHNQEDVKRSLRKLSKQPAYEELVLKEGKRIIDLFEDVFNHAEFTGRSGTFFAYEGLGSVYWHMVSKLLLAVQENVFQFQEDKISCVLVEKYRDIRSGLGFNKSPERFGAFPMDPYSHTPKGQGARQPGMTGTVKEEILTRIGELGIRIEEGCLVFNPILFDESELISASELFTYIDVADQKQELLLQPGTMAFLFCQVPIVLKKGSYPEIKVSYQDGNIQTFLGNQIDRTNSSHIFKRDGIIDHIEVTFDLDQ